jgi:hypothetical protein
VATMRITATTTQASNLLRLNSRVPSRDGKSKSSMGGAVLIEACSKIESPMLPRVLLKTHVKRTVIPMTEMTNATKGIRMPTKPVPAPLYPGTSRKRGRCHRPQSTPSRRSPPTDRNAAADVGARSRAILLPPPVAPQRQG